jgi:hypothetical protein
MSNLTQHLALENAIKRALPLDLDSIIEHLISECAEFLKGRKGDTFFLDDFAMGLDDKEFIERYEATIKDSKIDELADLRIIPNTLAEVLGIDLDKAEMLKHRYNNLR